jgi:hypothetical protein
MFAHWKWQMQIYQCVPHNSNIPTTYNLLLPNPHQPPQMPQRNRHEIVFPHHIPLGRIPRRLNPESAKHVRNSQVQSRGGKVHANATATSARETDHTFVAYAVG